YDGLYPSGTLVANADFRTGTPDWSGGSASDGLGNTWTITGNAFWVPPVFNPLVKLHVDNMGLSETAQRLRHLLRSADEDIQISETPLRLRGLLRSVDEPFALNETDLRFRGLVRSETENVEITETLLRFRTLLRS